MLSTINQYPQFVADQVLTNAHLNNLFDYLDEQGRMTRTNLIGIGIVCGLDITSTGTSVTISKGCGVTSQGYLVAMEESTYNFYSTYDAKKEKLYEKFVNVVSGAVSPPGAASPPDSTITQKLDLWELQKSTAKTSDGQTPLPLSTLTADDYLVILFVELLEINNKNCNPSTCDDKGVEVEVSVRPLLMKSADIDIIRNPLEDPFAFVSFSDWKEMKMPRWNVPAHTQITTADIVNSYKAILSPGFVTNVQVKLSNAYNNFNTLIGNMNEFGIDPFTNLATSFAFLNADVNINDLVRIQYYYDFFSDLLEAYDEFRIKGMEIKSICCPNPDLFPRHLLLGQLQLPSGNSSLSFRTYFIYSPLFSQKDLLKELKSLFRRMVLMINSLQLSAFAIPDTMEIKITPSTNGRHALSKKAIPYYYRPDPLYNSWSYEKFAAGKANQNLSYNAGSYNTPASMDNDWIINPLNYDLEPYNFLRIEGHLGKNYTVVQPFIQSLIDRNRLPITVAAIKTGDALIGDLREATQSCNMKDIETSYEIIRREWNAIIGKTIQYLDDNMVGVRNLLAEFMVGSDIVGDYMRLLHTAINFMRDPSTQAPKTLYFFISTFAEFIPIYENVESKSGELRRDLESVLNTGDISKQNANLAEDLIDHFDEVILSCKKGGFRSIFQEFESRIEDVYQKLYFKNFLSKNPGIEHKAGVSIGGTFILVYHPGDDMPTAAGDFNISGRVINNDGIPIPGAAVQVREIPSKSTVADINGNFRMNLTSLPATIEVNVIGLGRGSVRISSIEELNIKVVVPGEVFPGISAGTVVADFYLPYTCCSDCAPVQLVINEPAPNKPPVAKIAPVANFTLPIDVHVILNGTASNDPEGGALRYLWKKENGPAGNEIVFANPEDPTTIVTGFVAGEYRFSLTVTDDYGLTAIDSISFSVNAAPTANAGEDISIDWNPQTDNKVTLSGTGSDPEGGDITCSWREISGKTGFTVANPTTLNPEIGALVPGTYIFELTVTDNAGATATDNVNIIVRPPSAVPIAIINAVEPVTLPVSSITLDGSASENPGGGHLLYDWSQIEGPVKAEFTNDSEEKKQISGLLKEGSYKFQLIAVNEAGILSNPPAIITVDVIKNIARQKSCNDLSLIITGFDKLAQADNNLEKFKDAFDEYANVEKFFRLMKDKMLTEASVRDQIDFFKSPENEILSKLKRWLISLFALISNKNKPDTRLLALMLYRILIDLILYIACIQDEDFNSAEISLKTLFELMLKQMNSLTKDAIQKYSVTEKEQLVMIKALFQKELENLNINNEAVKKPLLGKILNQLIQVLSKLVR